MAYERSHFRIMGDRSLLVELGDRISPDVNRRVRELFIMLEKNPVKGVLETVPAYRSLLIIYDPLITNTTVLQHEIEDLQKKREVIDIPNPKTVEIPVVYGGEFGPDLEWVARYQNDHRNGGPAPYGKHLSGLHDRFYARLSLHGRAT
jgi:inhibitor of KinA